MRIIWKWNGSSKLIKFDSIVSDSSPLASYSQSVFISLWYRFTKFTFKPINILLYPVCPHIVQLSVVSEMKYCHEPSSHYRSLFLTGQLKTRWWPWMALFGYMLHRLNGFLIGLPCGNVHIDWQQVFLLVIYDILQWTHCGLTSPKTWPRRKSSSGWFLWLWPALLRQQKAVL